MRSRFTVLRMRDSQRGPRWGELPAHWRIFLSVALIVALPLPLINDPLGVGDPGINILAVMLSATFACFGGAVLMDLVRRRNEAPPRQSNDQADRSIP
jgi:hypothetical protein